MKRDIFFSDFGDDDSDDESTSARLDYIKTSINCHAQWILNTSCIHYRILSHARNTVILVARFFW